jgi:hypothetical protein
MTYGHDRDLLLLLLLLFAFAGMRRGMFGGGGWEKRMEQIREKVERDREEQRAFRDLMLAEMRRHNAAVEQQTALLTRIAGRLDATEGGGPSPAEEGAPPEAAAEHPETLEPRPRRNRKAGSEPAG